MILWIIAILLITVAIYVDLTIVGNEYEAAYAEAVEALERQARR